MSKSSAASQCLIEHWKAVGLPGYVQFDNDTTFRGTHAHPGVVGRVTSVEQRHDAGLVSAPASFSKGSTSSLGNDRRPGALIRATIIRSGEDGHIAGTRSGRHSSGPAIAPRMPGPRSGHRVSRGSRRTASGSSFHVDMNFFNALMHCLVNEPHFVIFSAVIPFCRRPPRSRSRSPQLCEPQPQVDILSATECGV